jgi:hypothetical protein
MRLYKPQVILVCYCYIFVTGTVEIPYVREIEFVNICHIMF